MCGACGRRTDRDQWVSVLASRRARWEVALVLNRVLAQSGHPGRVRAGPGPWVVCMPTGASHVADTISAVVRLLSSPRPLPALTLQELRHCRQTPVVAAVTAAVAAVGFAGRVCP